MTPSAATTIMQIRWVVSMALPSSGDAADNVTGEHNGGENGDGSRGTITAASSREQDGRGPYRCTG